MMTATQLLERLATSMIRGGDGSDADKSGPTTSDDELRSPSAAASARGGNHDVAAPTTTTRATRIAVAFDRTRGAQIAMTELPVVLLEAICGFLDHHTLHAVEETSVGLLAMVQQSSLWRHSALRDVVVVDDGATTHSWKEIVCRTQGFCREDKRLLKGIRAYSSADRPSESPHNTLMPSKCWTDIHKFQGRDTLDSPHEFFDIPSFVLTLGERIQMKCGCSTGSSCYWSSSASSNKHAADYIDYVLNGPCVISSVQIIPYRVFWHPGSPTYAPERVYFEFFECHDVDPAVEDGHGDVVTRASEVVPLYTSPEFFVRNEMHLQDFRLPMKIWATNKTILRIHLLGRHQAQTFELPPWMQLTEEDRLPKYYCCLSYVNALGLSSDTLALPHPAMMSPKKSTCESSSPLPTSFAEIMAAYVEGIMERRRRAQL